MEVNTLHVCNSKPIIAESASLTATCNLEATVCYTGQAKSRVK